MVFNERIRKLRKERKLTQGVVAQECGMTVRAYQRLETDAKPHYDSMKHLADFFQVSVDWLMGRTEDREVHQR
ncbi:helix-turn-helix transcriptional regulator [Intestinimonas sp.]|uniref:helix-turn-helix domain-containing protein n=1 Tax=Intestinimonas sp. TaxID=1965293 RepID=UPI0026221D47|nr:helix-turn-helix transcriptional regulator [Intestinimonas sp.]